MFEHHRNRSRAWRHRILLIVAVATVASVATVTPIALADGHEPIVTYAPPVDAPIVDRFRLPHGPFGPGNRGIDYATSAGTPVRAAAAGTVTFAGPVVGSLHVTVAHADGLRTTYAFLATVEVSFGASVEQGTIVGTAGEGLHFSLRRGDEYLDPETVLATTPMVHLVPDHDRDRASTDVPDVPTSASNQIAGSPVPSAALRWAMEPAATSCTAAGTPPAPPPPGRRVAVLVGGLGSSSSTAAIDDVDSAALGYAAGDVIRFSYRGGRIAVPEITSDDLATIPARPYAAADTTGDLRAAGARLADLLAITAAAATDAVINVIAHSQGGIVARIAVAHLLDARQNWVLGRIGTVITLGSPHQGADLATAVRLIDGTRLGTGALELVRAVAGLGVSADSIAVAQLAPGSPLLAELNARPLGPAQLVSIGARGDLVVPAHRTRLPGATNVVVSVPGLAAGHDALPGAATTQREIMLALAGLPPTCESAGNRITDAITGRLIGFLQLAAGALAALGATAAFPGG